MALKAARLTRNLPVATLSGRAPNYCGSIDGAGIPSASSSRLRSLRAGSLTSAHTHTHTPIRKHCRPHTHMLPSTHGLIVALLRRLIETEACVKGHKRYLVRPEEAAAAVTRQSEVGLEEVGEVVGWGQMSVFFWKLGGEGEGGDGSSGVVCCYGKYWKESEFRLFCCRDIEHFLLCF